MEGDFFGLRGGAQAPWPDRDFVLRGETQGRCRFLVRLRAASFPVLSFAGSLGSASVAVAPALLPPPTAAGASAASLPRSFDRTSSPMQRRDDPAARMSRSSGRSGSMDPSGAHPSVRQAPSRQPPLPHRSRGGGGGSRGGARASPATQPPPLLPPSATGPDATVGGPAPTPLLPPSATASVKMEPENKYLPELMAEKDSLDPSFTHAMQLLTAGKRASVVPLGRPATRGQGWQWLCFSRFPPPGDRGSHGLPFSRYHLRESGFHFPIPTQSARENF